MSNRSEYRTRWYRLLAGVLVSTSVLAVPVIVLALIAFIRWGSGPVSRSSFGSVTETVGIVAELFGAVIIVILPVWLILAHRGKMSGMKVAMTNGLTAGAASVIWFGLAMLYLLVTDTSHDNVLAAPLAGIVIVPPISIPLFGIASLAGWRIAYRRVPVEASAGGGGNPDRDAVNK